MIVGELAHFLSNLPWPRPSGFLYENIFIWNWRTALLHETKFFPRDICLYIVLCMCVCTGLELTASGELVTLNHLRSSPALVFLPRDGQGQGREVPFQPLIELYKVPALTPPTKCRFLAAHGSAIHTVDLGAYTLYRRYIICYTISTSYTTGVCHMLVMYHMS